MKPFLTALILSLALLTLPAAAAPRTVCVDELDDLTYPNGWASCSGLVPYAPSLQAAELSDSTAAALPLSASRTGSILYTVRGAEQAEIILYSHSGTFAVDLGGGCYLQGLPDKSMASAPRFPLFLPPEQNHIFLCSGASWRDLTVGRFSLSSFEPAEPPGEPLLPYGLSAASSPDGSSFTPLTLTRVPEREQIWEFNSSCTFYQEAFSVTLPADARFLRLTLRDAGALPTEQGTFVSVKKEYPMAIARVTFSGTELHLGAELPKPPVPVTPPEPPIPVEPAGPGNPDLEIPPPPPAPEPRPKPAAKPASRPKKPLPDLHAEVSAPVKEKPAPKPKSAAVRTPAPASEILPAETAAPIPAPAPEPIRLGEPSAPQKSRKAASPASGLGMLYLAAAGGGLAILLLSRRNKE